MKLIKLAQNNQNTEQTPFESVFEDRTFNYGKERITLYLSPKQIKNPQEFWARFLKVKNNEWIPWDEKITPRLFQIVSDPRIIEGCHSVIWAFDEQTIWHLPQPHSDYIKERLANNIPAWTSAIFNILVDSFEESIPDFAKEYWESLKLSNFETIHFRNKCALVTEKNPNSLNIFQKDIVQSEMKKFNNGENKELESRLLNDVERDGSALSSFHHPEIGKWLKKIMESNPREDVENGVLRRIKSGHWMPSWANDWFFNKYFASDPKLCVVVINNILSVRGTVDLNEKNKKLYIQFLAKVVSSGLTLANYWP